MQCKYCLSTQACFEVSELGYWLQHDYKGFSPGLTMETVTEEDWRAAPALQETPVTSAICDPVNGTQFEEGTEEVSGQYTHLHLCLGSPQLSLLVPGNCFGKGSAVSSTTFWSQLVVPGYLSHAAYECQEAFAWAGLCILLIFESKGTMFVSCETLKVPLTSLTSCSTLV